MPRSRLLCGLLLLACVSACSLLGVDPRPGSNAPTAAATPSGPPSSASSPSSKPTSTRSAADRPVQRVPDVTPVGIVDPPPGQGFARYSRQRIDWKPCEDDLQCAQVLAPLDYDHPDGRAVTLALARRPSTAAKPKGTLFINPGGPGGSGVDYVGFFKSAGLRDYDIVGWDPRGVGRSTPVQCFGSAELDRYNAVDSSPDDLAELNSWTEENREFGQSCLDRSGPLLSNISSIDTVRDLDLLRGLVGDDKLNFLGSSYGTYLGALYAQLFGPKVGRLVLDGAVDITNSADGVTQAQGFDRALNAFASWCVDQPTCRLGRSKEAVLKAVTGLWDRLDADPVPVGDRELTQSLAVAGVVFVLYENTSAFKYLQQALESVIFNHDGGYLLYLADSFNQRDDKGNYGQLGYAFPAVRCLDEADHGIAGAVEEAQEIARKAPTIGRYFGPDLVCPMWPVPPGPKAPKITGAGAGPILVIGTTGDPATPYEYAQSMVEQLKSGVLVTFKGEGHLAYDQSRCVQRIVVNYFVDGTVPADGTIC